MIRLDKSEKIWFTSDLHLGHEKEFLWAPRGFSSIEEHDAEIIKKWNSIVGDNDLVFVLGDIMVGGDQDASIDKLNQLNGRLFFIWGNHDGEAKIERYVHEVSGFIGGSYAELIKYGKYNFYLSHYPTLVHNENDFKTVWNLHGHTHDPRTFNDYYHCYNVNPEAHNNYPVVIDKIISDIKGLKKEISD